GAEKDFQPHVYARLVAGQGQRCSRHLGTREARLPAVCRSAARHRLGRPRERAGPTHGEAADLGEDQEAVIETRAPLLTHRLVGEAVVALAALEAGRARCLTCRYSAEARLECAVQAP